MNRHRSDIDGMRALSALSVVLFHAGVAGFRGGFLGVDVFFVISGYLITGVLTENANQSVRRRLQDFYMRRCRRILPALFALLLAATAAALSLLSGDELRRYGAYLGSTCVFLTNLVAWRDHAAGWPQLVHLWSIAVEEQFYLGYPLLLLVICKARAGRAVPVLGALALLSFALCVWASYKAPQANQYLLPTRAWELLLGALLALCATRQYGRAVRELLCASSLIVIVVCVSTYSLAAHPPGLSTLAPCVAAGTLLSVGRGGATLAGRLLSLPPLVFTGLISYSLYLWHVPVLALYAYRFGTLPGALPTVLLIGVSYLLAAASWYWVEQPFRTRRWLQSNARFLTVAVALDAALGCTGLLLLCSPAAAQPAVTPR